MLMQTNLIDAYEPVTITGYTRLCVFQIFSYDLVYKGNRRAGSFANFESELQLIKSNSSVAVQLPSFGVLS